MTNRREYMDFNAAVEAAAAQNMAEARALGETREEVDAMRDDYIAGAHAQLLSTGQNYEPPEGKPLIVWTKWKPQ